MVIGGIKMIISISCSLNFMGSKMSYPLQDDSSDLSNVSFFSVVKGLIVKLLCRLLVIVNRPTCPSILTRYILCSVGK